MKLLKSSIVATALVLSTSTNAALIDNGDFTTDTESKLDWLDLSFTYDIGGNYRISNFPGWRNATGSEVENLFTTLFGDAYTHSQYQGTLIYNTDVRYEEVTSSAVLYQSLFGVNNTFTYAPGNSSSDALYSIYEGGYATRMTSVVIADTYTAIYDVEELGFNDYPYGQGHLLVRTSVVPVPSAVWLFGSGLIGLVGLARRKKA